MELRPLRHMKRLGEKYPDAWKRIEVARELRGSQKELHWPNWCYLPIAGVYPIVYPEGKTFSQDAIDLAALAALGAWRMTKGIYRFDETVRESIQVIEGTSKIPVDVLLRLPEWCVYIEIPIETSLVACYGFYAFLEFDVNTRRRELRIVFDMHEPHSLVPSILHLVEGDTLEQGMQRALSVGMEEQIAADIREAQVRAALTKQMSETIQEAYRYMTGQALGYILYLCTQNADIAGDGVPENPQPRTTKKHGKRLFASPGVKQWEVGYRIGSAIRTLHKRAEKTQGSTGTGAKKIAHVRRAHWHRYWTGPKKNQTLIVKWLPPIPIGFSEKDLDELLPTIHPVKQ